MRHSTYIWITINLLNNPQLTTMRKRFGFATAIVLVVAIIMTTVPFNRFILAPIGLHPYVCTHTCTHRFAQTPVNRQRRRKTTMPRIGGGGGGEGCVVDQGESFSPFPPFMPLPPFPPCPLLEFAPFPPLPLTPFALQLFVVHDDYEDFFLLARNSCSEQWLDTLSRKS